MSEIFDHYYDKYKNVLAIVQSDGRVAPKLWKDPTKNAAKGVEIGGGFALSTIEGHLASDQMRAGNSPEQPQFISNQSGGILGGISSGQQIVVRVAIKPTSSILTTRKSVDLDGKNVDVRTKGRHDPCVGIRGVPVAEAMMSLVLVDMLMRHHAQTGILEA